MEGGDLCMSSIDERIVRMKFDNAQFSQGASSTLKMLDQLKAALKFEGAANGLNEASAAVGRFSTAGAQEQVSGLSQKFSALQVAAITALANITSKAVDAGLSLAKSLTLEPIMSGFHEYETNLNSIQTILANTGLKGAEGLQKVNSALDELNHYADQTIYNFSEMARNIGTFTAAGVTLDVASNAIKGIANLAAVSGSNAEQASSAMYQLSQAISAGKVTLEDWNSVVNAGMGGKVFQDALMDTARVHGVAVDKIVKDEGSFRLSLQKGWLTSNILTETLSKFTGDLTADQLKSMGYNQQQIAGILEMGKTAVDAATKVKTMTQLIDTLREAVGSGWAKTWQIVFGDFDEAKGLFTEVNNVLGGMIQKSAEARNNLLQGWKDLGGRQALIDGISNAFKALMSILTPIKDAFRDIFPATTAQQLYNMTTAFRDFMQKLILGSETADNLRRTFAGFFAILGIGWELLKAGVKFIFDLLGALTSGSGGFLKFTGNIGDFLVALHKAIKDGDAFGKIFGVLGKILQVPINLLKALGTLLGNLFSGAKDGATAAKDGITGLTESLSPMQKLGSVIKSIWAGILSLFTSISQKVQQVAKDFIQWASGVGAAISGALGGKLDFSAILKAVNTGLFATLVVALKKFMSSIGDKGPGGFLNSLKDSLDALTGALKGMQNALNAAALLAIAAAIGILTLSVIALSKIDNEGITRASIAIGVMFAQLSIAFKALDAISTMGSAAKITVLSAGLILLAVAVRILTSSVEKLAEIPFSSLIKGLGALVVILLAVAGTTRLMESNNPGIIKTAAGLVILAAAIRLLVTSVEALGGMDWGSLAKGLTGVAVLLTSLALFTKFAEADKGGIGTGVGLILLATALKILASAVGDFAQFSWGELAKGMASVAVGLGLITAAMNLLPTGSVLKAAGVVVVAAALEIIADAVGKMGSLSWGEIARGLTVMAASLLAISLAIGLLPPTSLVSAAGILVVAAALEILADAMKKMGGMSWEEVAKSLIVLAGSLIIISAALVVASGTLPGAAAIIVMAAALAILAPVLKTLGGMSWSDIAAGLVALAGVFVIIGVAGLVLGPLVPVIAGLAVSIGLLGIAVLAAGIGVLAFATGLTILAAAGAGATAAIVGIVSGLVGLIPYVMEQIAVGLVLFAQVIATAGPSILAAITTVLNSLLQAIIDVTPKIMETLGVLLDGMLKLLVSSVPKMVDAGFKILIGFLRGIADNIGQVVDVATDVIVNFLDGIGRNIGRIIQAGIDLIFDFLDGLATGIRSSGKRLADAGWDIAKAMIDGVIDGLKSLAGRALDAAWQFAKDMLNKALSALGIKSPSKEFYWAGQMMVLGAANGLDDFAHIANDSAGDLGNGMVDAMGKSLDGLSKVLGKDLIDFDPTITPVLDLTQIKKDAGEISNLLSLSEFDVNSTLKSAKAAGAGFELNRTDDSSNTSGETSGNSTTFIQNNSSPKELNAVEIYRQTNNLISTAKKGGTDA
jgi:tape measure domain-containing protein